ncbi:MAG TPA: cysteine desulfurase-like protein [Acidimicrobiia bacterium]|nr:cysteine desulfurase-like protein [Acidimicrobiia bacterium]
MLDVEALRAEFPAFGGSQIYLDSPAGTQVPNAVTRAITTALTSSMSNVGGAFAASRRSEATVIEARAAGADLVGARPDEIVFGPNMTTLTFALSRALAEAWQPGEKVIVSGLDHDANITPWVRAATNRGLEVAFIDIDPVSTGLDLDHLDSLLDDRTRLVAVTGCSNAFGTLVDLPRVTAAARAVGALSYVDAVHLAPHRRIDVRELGADFLICSSYKFFGPHLGMAYVRSELLESLPAFKVRPAPNQGPGRWETGTPPFELLAGFTAAVDYLASVGWGGDRRGALDSAFSEIATYEAGLGDQFLAGLPAGIQVIGHPTMQERVPTFALESERMAPAEVAVRLGQRGLAVWAGHHYAVEPMARLGFLDKGGLTRVGLTHVTTREEVDALLSALTELES